MTICISSGHGLHVAGARSIIDEVTEARRVTDRMSELIRQTGVNVITFHENEARNARDNVNNIINFHNEQTRDLDVSVHFNAVDGVRDAGIGVETCYRRGNAEMKDIASRASKAISDASGLILRRGDGTMTRSDLGFLSRTNINRAILLEVCFVNSRTDVRLYQEHFEEICKAIAEAITGRSMVKPKVNLTPIMGKPVATSAQMRAYINRINPSVLETIPDLTELFISEGNTEGVRGDIAFAQSCLETGNFMFIGGTAVTLSQNNFSGMGVTSLGVEGNSFPTPQIGIRAQIHHLKAYACTTPNVNPNESPRAHFVQRGVAPYVEWLGAQENPHGRGWAAGAGYGKKILRILNAIIDTEAAVTVITPKLDEAIKNLVYYGVINSPDYWRQHAFDIKFLDRLLIILSGAKFNRTVLTNITTPEEAIDRIAAAGLINSPDYWKERYGNLEWLGQLLINVASRLEW